MFLNTFNGKSGSVAVAILLVLSLIAGSAVVYKRTQPRPSSTPVATQGVPTLSFVREAQTATSSDNFDLILQVNPNGAEFHAFELYVVYDPFKAEFADNANLASNIVSSHPLIIASVDPVNKLISVVGTRTGTSFSGSENLEIARIKMKTKSGASGSVSFNWAENTKLGNKLPTQNLNLTF